MQILVGLFRMFLGTILFIIAGTGFNYYYNDTDPDLDRYRKLWEDGQETQVTFIDQEAPSDYSVRGVDIVADMVDFQFEFNGETYFGNDKFDEDHFMTRTYNKVHFMPNDPTNYELNLQEKIRDKKQSNSSSIVFWIALIIGLLGIPIFINGLKEIRYFINRKRRKKNNTHADAY